MGQPDSYRFTYTEKQAAAIREALEQPDYKPDDKRPAFWESITNCARRAKSWEEEDLQRPHRPVGEEVKLQRHAVRSLQQAIEAIQVTSPR